MSVIIDGTTGITTPGLTNTGTETILNLTTTGNTILGDATTDTLTVGVTGIVKDASGNVGIGTTAPAEALDVGTGNVKMGWERISNTCNNPATTCTAASPRFMISLRKRSRTSARRTICTAS